MSYAKTFPVTASDLATLVREALEAPVKTERTSPSSGALIDEIINSELEQRRPGMNTRLTPARADAGVDTARHNESFDASATNLTFVDVPSNRAYRFSLAE